jgi:hypothetical protein
MIPVRCITLATLALLAAAMPMPALHAAGTQSSYKEEVRAGLEEIFVFRTTRTQHQSGKTPACAAAPFESASEDYYDLWSIELRSNDARVVDTHQKEVGGFTACFSRLVQNNPLLMYARGKTAGISWAGAGECVALNSQPPVRTVVAFTCRLNLTSLPAAYSGGFLVSSTLAPFLPHSQDPRAHVPGYLSTSIVTMRVWKKPAQ